MQVWLLLTLICSGHVNAQCHPVIGHYDTYEQCAREMTDQSVCFPTFLEEKK